MDGDNSEPHGRVVMTLGELLNMIIRQIFLFAPFVLSQGRDLCFILLCLVYLCAMGR